VYEGFVDTLWGVIIGGAIAVLSNFALHRTELSREREGRREVRRDADRDRQREALIAQQEGLAALQNLSVEQGLRALEGTMDINSPFEVLNLRSRVEFLIARVTDEEAGKVARRAANRASAMIVIKNRDQLSDSSDRLFESMRDFHQRVGLLLKGLEEA